MRLLKKLLFLAPRHLRIPSHVRFLLRGARKRTRLMTEIRKVTGISAPSAIVVTLTNACNQNCSTCTYRVSNRINLNIRFLPYEDIKKLVDEVAPYGTNFLFAGGGEPTLHPRIDEIVAYVSSKGLYSEITTNGFILRNRVRELVEAGIGKIVVSIDGPEGMHDSVRGRKDSYARAIDGIMELNKIKRRPPVAVSTTVSPMTWKSLPEFLRTVEVLVRAGKIDYLIVRHMQHLLGQGNLEYHNRKFGKELFYARSNEYDDMDFDSIHAEQLHRLVEWSDRTFLWLLWVGKRMSVTELYKYYKNPDVFIRDRRVYCPWIYANITENGDVVLCNEVTASNDFCFGNISEQSFLKIWNTSPKLIRFREILQKHGKLSICARCCGYISYRF